VSSQNLAPRLRQRTAIVAVAAAGVALAAWLGGRPDLAVGDYEFFLLLLGSVFVPLFGVFVADYFVLRHRGYDARQLFDRSGGVPGLRARAMVPWAAGFLLYQWCVGSQLAWWNDAMRTLFHSWLHLPFPLWNSAFGASVPSFAAALLLAVVVLPRPPALRGGVSTASR
jgi:purine-cytosine permease-like protein